MRVTASKWKSIGNSTSGTATKKKKQPLVARERVIVSDGLTIEEMRKIRNAAMTDAINPAWKPKVGDTVFIPPKVREQVAVNNPTYNTHDLVWKDLTTLSGGQTIATVISHTQSPDLITVQDAPNPRKPGMKLKKRMVLVSRLRPFRGWPTESIRIATTKAKKGKGITKHTSRINRIKAIVKANKETICLFKSNDFYEVFFGDAVECQRLLGLTVTTQQPGHQTDEMHTAGFPAKDLEGNLRKLVAAGHKVSVDETLDPVLPAVKLPPPDPTEPRLTPLMKKYQSIKKEHPDAILLFRMGDFYELFFEDAQTAARIVGLTLMTRDKASANPVPMAGFPYHQLDGYLRKLINAGFRVSVCEQVE